MGLKIKKFFKEEFIHNLREKYKLVIMNKNTYEEKFSLELSLSKVFVLVTISTIILIIFTIIMITITPLREYIPGYGSSKQGQKIVQMQMQMDSLQKSISAYELYRENLQNVFIDEDFSQDTLAFETKEVVKNQALTFAYTKEDSMLLNMEVGSPMVSNDPFMVSKKRTHNYSLLYVPFRGEIVSKYNPIENHYGIVCNCDITVDVNAISSGNVLFVSKDINFHHVIGIQHPDNMVSIYTFKGSNLLEQGDIVKAGQYMGSVSNLSPKVYFELWINGKAVNPESYIAF